MSMHNADVAALFEEMANLLEIKGDNPYRIRAYRNAAQTIRNLSTNLAEMIAQGEDLEQLPGVGKKLAKKIVAAMKTGSFPALQRLETRLPPALNALTQVSGLGGKRIKALFEGLGIQSLEDLKEAAKTGKIQGLKGFGEKSEQKILAGLAAMETGGSRVSLVIADKIVQGIAIYLRQKTSINNIRVVGSIRRQKETIGDGDILVACDEPSEVMSHFLRYEDVAEILAHGETKSSVRLKSNFQIDVRVVPEEDFGAALLYFTGSKAHNIVLRKRALGKKLKLNEYGLFRGRRRVAGKTEEEVYEKLGLPFIEPELREDRGEIQAAMKGALPKLITLADIRGDLHMHTSLTDGKNTMEQIVEAAQNLGYEYVGITEHSPKLVAKGLKPKDVEKYIESIRKLNARLKNIVVLAGMEVDILEDGSLDLPDDALKELDYRVCSVHYAYNLSKERQTLRVLKAMENPYFNIFGHPTSRLIGQREPYDIDIDMIIQAAKDNGCILEINSQSQRLDLNDVHCRLAKDHGVKLVISTDSHSIGDLDNMRYGVGQARRGWLEKKDVVNTRPLSQLRKMLKR